MNDKFEMIKDRIAHILRAKNLTATQFAEIMQIQPSNVSHILNGRNKPSLDFIVKLKEVFPEYSFDWIIMGKKPITTSEPNLFSKEIDFNVNQEDNTSGDVLNEYNRSDFNVLQLEQKQTVISNIESLNESDKLKQIIYVYSDRTFEVYNVRK